MRLAFAWPGLPDYAARCIRAVIDRDIDLTVVATLPSVPIEGMERSLGQRVHWIDGAAEVTWESLDVVRPDVLFIGGYGVKAFNKLAKEVSTSRGRVILMSDTNWQNSFRQRFIDPLRFHFNFRRRTDAVFVPGVSGERYASRMGYPQASTWPGLYGADPKLFRCDTRLVDRPKNMLFVGQFIPRKNVLGLVEAFRRFAATNRDWTLQICGNGPQRKNIADHPQIKVESFVQPTELAAIMQKARCLVLPSFEEHWGLVVHEAALSGCALALSSAVGALDDLADSQNAVVFRSGDSESLEHALLEVASWDDVRWQKAESSSIDCAKKFGPDVFADSVQKIISVVCE